jgi:hypothetical protein
MNNNNKTLLFEFIPVYKKFNLDVKHIIKDGDFEITLYIELHDKVKIVMETEFNQLNFEIDGLL